MKLIIPNDYVLHLSTGETITVAEFDSIHIPELSLDVVHKGCSSLLQKTSHIAREILEEAKIGYDANFIRKLGSSPTVCLMKVANPSCAMNDPRECTMASEACTTKNTKKSLGLFPECFVFQPEELDPDDYAKSVGTAIILAWRLNRYSIVVT